MIVPSQSCLLSILHHPYMHPFSICKIFHLLVERDELYASMFWNVAFQNHPHPITVEPVLLPGGKGPIMCPSDFYTKRQTSDHLWVEALHSPVCCLQGCRVVKADPRAVFETFENVMWKSTPQRVLDEA